MDNMDENNLSGWPFRLTTKPVQLNAFPKCMDKIENHDGNSETNISVSIVSFNMLAESYISPRSHPNLPNSFASIVFEPSKRRELLTKTLHKLIHGPFRDLDILCLQEVDLYDEVVEPFMKNHGYLGFSTKIKSANLNPNSHKKVDSCAIFWRKRTLDCIEQHIVEFDDLSKEEFIIENKKEFTKVKTIVDKPDQNNLRSSMTNNDAPTIDIHGNPYPTNPSTYYNKKKKIQYRKQTPSSLTGVIQSFLRHNASCILLFKHKEQSNIFAVTSTHLYWNPEYEYVKLSQSKYLLNNLKTVISNYVSLGGKSKVEDIPVLVCGDMNSKPNSTVYRFFVDKMGINAKQITPWYAHHFENNRSDAIEAPDMKSSNQEKVIGDEIILSQMEHLGVCEKAGEDNIPQIRYLLDYSLNKFTRWLRMLGIDAELETEAEEEERTRSLNPHITLFDRCRDERRTLLTTSYKLLQRKGCPAGSYFINPTSQTMEQSLCHLLLTHGVILEPTKFLIRCVKCNGCFREITEESEKKHIFDTNNAPMLMDLGVWECTGCHQGYWWSERPGSSASRVKNQVTKLFRLALRAGVEYRGPMGMFNFVNVQEERKYGNVYKNGLPLITSGQIKAMEWLKDETLSHPYNLQSMYAKVQPPSLKKNDKYPNRIFVGDEILPFTNVTDDFVGTLDYIFYEPEKWTLKMLLHVPTSFKEMNPLDIPKGHLIPSAFWPSDHLAIGGQLILKSRMHNKSETAFETDSNDKLAFP